MPSPRRARPARATATWAAVAVVGGCALGPGSADGYEARTLTDPVDEAASAVATGTLVVELAVRDRAFATVADTALLDAIGDAGGAQSTLAADVPRDPPLVAARHEAVVAVAQAVAALADARAWVNRTADRDAAEVLDALSSAAEALDAAVARAERA